MITKVKFKGQNGSLGFIKGTEYWLKIAIKTKVNITPVGDNGKPCVYNSLRLFLDNWEILE